MGARVFAETPGEARFFKDCPHRRYLHLHHESSPWDLHALAYTVVGISELEFVRIADAIIDLPLPGPPWHPCRRTIDAIRGGYDRLPPWRLIQRTGELVDALQLAELSVGDASATYSGAASSTAGPGSGMFVRVDKLIDWLQRVTGDLNSLTGRMVGRWQGLVQWSVPARAVDGLQGVVLKTGHRLSLMCAFVIEQGFTGVELIGAGVVNLGYHRPHQEETVFLRLPMTAYRTHELWILEHRSRLLIGTAAGFAHSTHAALAHHRRPLLPEAWNDVDRLGDAEPIIIMTTVRMMARAPDSLKPYEVPAAWVLNEPEE